MLRHQYPPTPGLQRVPMQDVLVCSMYAQGLYYDKHAHHKLTIFASGAIRSDLRRDLKHPPKRHQNHTTKEKTKTKYDENVCNEYVYNAIIILIHEEISTELVMLTTDFS